jgi:hypothetical protein
VSGVHKSRADALDEIDRFAIHGTALERLEALGRIDHRKQRLSRLVIRAMPRWPVRLRARLLLLEVSGIEHDQPRELAGGGGRDDFAAKPAPGQQR